MAWSLSASMVHRSLSGLLPLAGTAGWESSKRPAWQATTRHSALWLERARVCRDVHGVLVKRCHRHDLQRRLVGGGKYDRRSHAVVVGPGPVCRGHAPAVARHQSGEAVLRPRRRQVVADAALVVQELGRDHRADGVTSKVLRAGAAAAITIEPGHRVGAARLQVGAEDIALCHGPIIAPAG